MLGGRHLGQQGARRRLAFRQDAGNQRPPARRQRQHLAPRIRWVGRPLHPAERQQRRNGAGDAHGGQPGAPRDGRRAVGALAVQFQQHAPFRQRQAVAAEAAREILRDKARHQHQPVEHELGIWHVAGHAAL
jgi:hypothetical protein